jgi:hypothetical protein
VVVSPWELALLNHRLAKSDELTPVFLADPSKFLFASSALLLAC